jgi:succinate dehydrogenase / fumarate reductase, cytochrome b subunit
MLSWLIRTFRSSIGKKVLMALTGLALIGFLLVHATGNMTFYADSDGTAFDKYAETIGGNPLLPIAELALAGLFIAHIALGITVTLGNGAARTTGYARRQSHGQRTAGSATMWITGLVILAFIILHLVDFRMQKEEGVSFAAMMRVELARPIGAMLYVIGVAALGLHLTHAFKSALQTLGLNHPKYNELVSRLSLGIGVVLGLAFVSFPIILFTGGGA